MNRSTIKTGSVILASVAAIGLLVALGANSVWAGGGGSRAGGGGSRAGGGGSRADAGMKYASLSTGAETESNGTVISVGQVGIGRTSGGDQTASLGVLYSLTAAAGCPNTCGDIDGSGGSVNLVDFATFALCFGRPSSVSTACQCSDLNNDGVNNLVDFATFSLNFGRASTNAPPNCP